VAYIEQQNSYHLPWSSRISLRDD